MKIWKSDTLTPTHRIVKIHCEDRSAHQYVGDLNDEELEDFLLTLDPDIDLAKNAKLIKYYGYLHLFITLKP